MNHQDEDDFAGIEDVGPLEPSIYDQCAGWDCDRLQRFRDKLRQKQGSSGQSAVTAKHLAELDLLIAARCLGST